MSLVNSDTPIELATCCTCKCEKPRSEFYLNPNKKNSCSSSCKECERARKPRKKQKREIPEGHAWCIDCNAAMPKEEFHKARHRANGLSQYCKKCLSSRNLKWRSQNDRSLRTSGKTETKLRKCILCMQEKPSKIFSKSSTSQCEKLRQRLNAGRFHESTGCNYLSEASV
jgi:hypothetical protein